MADLIRDKSVKSAFKEKSWPHALWSARIVSSLTA